MDRTVPIPYPTSRPSFLLLLLVGMTMRPCPRGRAGRGRRSDACGDAARPEPATIAAPPFDPVGPENSRRRRPSKRRRGAPRKLARGRFGGIERSLRVCARGNAQRGDLAAREHSKVVTVSILELNDNVVKTSRHGYGRNPFGGRKAALQHAGTVLAAGAGAGAAADPDGGAGSDGDGSDGDGLGACRRNGEGRAQGACEPQARSEEESDAPPSPTTSDAASGRNPPAPFGLRAARGHLRRCRSSAMDAHRRRRGALHMAPEARNAAHPVSPTGS